MFDQNASIDILVDLDAKGIRGNHCGARATKSGIASFDLDNRLKLFAVGTFGADLPLQDEEKSNRYFRLTSAL